MAPILKDIVKVHQITTVIMCVCYAAALKDIVKVHQITTHRSNGSEVVY